VEIPKFITININTIPNLSQHGQQHSAHCTNVLHGIANPYNAASDAATTGTVTSRELTATKKSVSRSRAHGSPNATWYIDDKKSVPAATIRKTRLLHDIVPPQFAHSNVRTITALTPTIKKMTTGYSISSTHPSPTCGPA
jgi:hypothetical protein